MDRKLISFQIDPIKDVHFKKMLVNRAEENTPKCRCQLKRNIQQQCSEKTLDTRWQQTGKQPGVQSKSKMHLTCLGWTVTTNDFKKKLDKLMGKQSIEGFHNQSYRYEHQLGRYLQTGRHHQGRRTSLLTLLMCFLNLSAAGHSQEHHCRIFLVQSNVTTLISPCTSLFPASWSFLLNRGSETMLSQAAQQKTGAALDLSRNKWIKSTCLATSGQITREKSQLQELSGLQDETLSLHVQTIPGAL